MRDTAQSSQPIKVSIVEVPVLKVQQEIRIQEKNTSDNGPQYINMFLAELLGTALLMFFGCMGCVDQNAYPIGGVSFGLTVLMIIQMLGHVSGAHLNPAVTIATVLFGQLSIPMALVYVVAQFVGATLGYGLLKVLLPSDQTGEGFCFTTLDERLTTFQGLGIEIVITTVLILVCCAVWDKRNVEKQDSVPIRFGACIAVISIVAGPFTGASMNTARSLAPLVYGGSWKDHWIYWVGPNVAPFLACGIYKFIFEVVDSQPKEEQIYLDESQNRAEKV